MYLLKQLIQFTYAPFMLVGFISSGVYLISGGAGYHYLMLLLLAAVTVSFIMERIVPYNKEWNRDHLDTTRDILHSIINEASYMISLAALPIFVFLLPKHNFWPSEWHIGAQLLLAIIVADCGITLVHYWSHKYNWLWKFHAVHHSVKRMYGFNGLMKHPVHLTIELIGGTFPLILMGIPTDIAALLAFASAIQLLLQHTNVDVKIGPLRYILALSPVHRFHHIKWAGEGDVNFGLFTTIWDHLLGTTHFDSARSFKSEDIGIGKEPDYPTSYLKQLSKPFKSQS